MARSPKLRIALLIAIFANNFVVIWCQKLSCIYSPYIGDYPNPKSLERYPYCPESFVTSDMIKAWNGNLKVSIMFYQIHICVTLKEKLYIELNQSCLIAVEKQFSYLYNKPVCCNIESSDDHSQCYYSSFELCKNIYNPKDIHELKGTANHFASAICRGQLQKYTECRNSTDSDFKSANCGEWNQNILLSKYIHFGCLNRDRLISGLTGPPGNPHGNTNINNPNDATLSMLAGSFCHLSPGRNCCHSGDLCNLVEAAAAINEQSQLLPNWTALRVGPPPTSGPRLSPTSVLTSIAAALVGFLGLAALAAAAAGLAILCHRCDGVLTRRDKMARLLARFGLRRHPPGQRDNVQQENLLMQRLHEEEAEAERRRQLQQDDPTGRAEARRHQRRGSGQGEGHRCYSSSGYGNPSLVQRTISRDTTVSSPVGQGRFGQVFKGTWRAGGVSDTVAVKVFNSRAEASWSREGEIYATPGLAHPAILGFIAMDNLDAGWETQLWLITDFHANGSLQSYLTEHSIDWRVAARMCHSIVSGLCHLHTELVTASFSKPGIAHCDVKSNNILVKADLTCCLADFGLAVKQTDELNTDGDRRVGTIRYLSPELLDGSLAANSLAALKQADLYALGLVLWEVGHRCHRAAAYSLPYADSVPSNPSIEDMRQLVCEPRCGRPDLPVDDWLGGDPACRALSDGLLQSLWHQQPAERLGALQVKQRTAGLAAVAAADVPDGN